MERDCGEGDRGRFFAFPGDEARGDACEGDFGVKRGFWGDGDGERDLALFFVGGAEFDATGVGVDVRTEGSGEATLRTVAFLSCGRELAGDFDRDFDLAFLGDNERSRAFPFEAREYRPGTGDGDRMRERGDRDLGLDRRKGGDRVLRR